MTQLILASASAVRAHVLDAAGVTFDVMAAHVDEDAIKESLLALGTPLHGIADALAELKAVRVSSSMPDALVLGADQVLVFEGRLINKCTDLDEACRLLRCLRGKTHKLISALVLAKAGNAIWRHVESAQLWMRDVSDVFLDDYLTAEGQDILKGVGCYRLEGRGAQLFERVEGDYFTVLGLPLLPLLAPLRQHGVIAT
jgi:septum formation protein